MAGSTWSNPAITYCFSASSGKGPAVSTSGNDPTIHSSRRSHRSRHSRRNHPSRRRRGTRDSHGNRRSRAPTQPARRCRHFPCRTDGTWPSSHRRFLLHRASLPETSKGSISAECPQPVQPMLKRHLPAKKSNPRHLKPASWPSPRSSASKPASPVTLLHPPYLWEISIPALLIPRDPTLGERVTQG